MNAHSDKRLAAVMPELARRVRSVVAALERKGLTVECVQGFRTFAEQDALWAQGRLRKGPVVTNAKGGQSFHNFGLACDLCPFKGGKPDWNDARAFDAIGAEAKRAGLEWGGDWRKSPDRPHVQLAPLPIKECLALYRKGGLPLVWASVEARLKP